MLGSLVRCENLYTNSDRCQHRYVDEAEKTPTGGDTEKRKEGDTNTFGGDIIVVLELLAIVGAVRGTLMPFEVWNLSQGSQYDRKDKYALITLTGIAGGVLEEFCLSSGDWTCF